MQLRRRAGGPRPGRPQVGAAAVAAASRAMYRSAARSSVSSHRPKESGGGDPRTSRSSGSSSGPARRTSPPTSCSSSSRTPARRPRSPSGHRGRRASPSPPRGRRGSPSPPRGRRASPSPPRGRRGSPSPPRARRGSPSPPRGRRLFPPGSAGFRGSSRGESRADFARDGRGDHPGDSGSRVIPPLHPDSVLQPPLPQFPLSETPAARTTRGLQAGVPTWKALHPHGLPQRRPNQGFPRSAQGTSFHNNGFGTRPGAGSGRRAAFPGNRLVLSLCVRCEKVCRARGSSSTPCAWYFFSSWCP